MVSDFKRKQKGLQEILFGVAGIFVLGICFFLGIKDIQELNKKRKLSQQLEVLKQEVIEAQKNNQDLKQGIAKSSDSDYIEKVAREQLDLQKQGEKVVTFIMPKEKITQTATEGWSQNWLGSFWQRVLNFFSFKK